jgi:cell division septation protein DedD
MYRIDRIVTPARAAGDILSRSEELLNAINPGGGEASPAVTTTPSPTAPGNSTTSSSRTTVKVVDGGKWRVQLGSFTQQKSAQDLVDNLRQHGYEAKIDKVAVDSTTAFKVWVGTFSTKEDASQTVTELQADGFEKGFVVESK